ncbi:hypothetical protein AWB76_02429 [Caballeronia temeraria]|uniref:Uncharacterized protein n=1 Tax=Caballeronia temeraria TaxID=1777137 RepID=A0A158AJR2_9BURK|nr:hypothetical protein [Caballeronia temeraria]SAK57297.1 hypothetical protein AWB76_02429 [Caballeronia temeraria]
MRIFARLRSESNGPVWGVCFGAILTVAGAGLWWCATDEMDGEFDESVALVAMLIGASLAAIAGREILHSADS